MAGGYRRLRVRIRLGLLAVVVGALAVTGVAPAQQVYEHNQLIAREKARLAALTETNEALESRLARSQDPAYVEKLAREQLGLVRPGETAYVVIPGPPVAAPPKPAPEPQGMWDRLWDWVRDTL